MACAACKKGLPCTGEVPCKPQRLTYAGSQSGGDIEELVELADYKRLVSVSFVAIDSSGAAEAVGVEVSFVDRTIAAASAGTTSLKRKLYEDRRTTPLTDSFYLLGPDGKGYAIPASPKTTKPYNLYLFADLSAMSAGSRGYFVVEVM